MFASFALLLALTGTIQFNVDWVAYRAPADSSRIEFFYSIPHDQLLYVDSAGQLSATFTVKMQIRGVANGFVQSGEFRKRARLPAGGFVGAVERRRTFVDGFSVTAPPGSYRFELAVTDSAPTGFTTGTVRDSLTLPDFGQSPSLSTLHLGARITVDSVTGAVAVIPNPSHEFGVVGLDTVYFYYEAYNLAPDTNQYGLETRVIGARSDTVLESGLMLRTKNGNKASSALGLSVRGLAPGAYTLVVELTDLVTRRSTTRERRFTVGSSERAGPAPRLGGLDERELAYYHEVQYLTTPRQYAFYEALSDSGKEAWLADFWPRHNLAEFARRMDVADQRFHRPKLSGVKTDRGRIYVKYGEPDAIEQHVIESDIRPREYWHYYNSGYAFVFIDMRGDGNYRLAWTNAKDEPSTGFEQYLSPEEQEEFK